MENNQREKLKLQIQQRIAELENLLSSSGEGEPLNSSSEVDKQVTENERAELILLTKNLQWLDSEDAGYCQQCDNEIPFARLKAVPVTRLCIQCAP